MTRCCPQREGPIAFWSSSGICVSLLPRRRRQPSGGSARAEPVFPTRGRWPPRECRRHVMVVGALVPPDAVRIATSVATVYTSAPKWLREAVFADLCTLLRSLTCPQRRNSVHECPKTAPRGHFSRSVYTPASPHLSTTVQQCTQVPQNGSERPFSSICVHSCVPTTARATGWGHGSHDIDGPMALVMPGLLDLRPTPPGQ